MSTTAVVKNQFLVKTVRHKTLQAARAPFCSTNYLNQKSGCGFSRPAKNNDNLAP